MPHAIVDIARNRFEGVEVAQPSGLVALNEFQARRYFEATLIPMLRADHESTVGAVGAARSRFLAGAQLYERVEPRDPQMRAMRGGELVDRVVVDGETTEVYAGRGRRFLESLGERRFPDSEVPQLPAFDDWWASSRSQVGHWTAQIVTSDGPQPIDVSPDVQSGRSFPLDLAVGVLDRLEQQGWRLVQVSEDRALTDDAGSAAAVVERARYLLHKS